jgi:rhodanese-related sulfurtransferase
MKTIIIATLLSLSITSFAQAPAPATAGDNAGKNASASKNGQGAAATSRTKELTRAEFDKLLASPEHLLVIDLRRPDELTSVGGFPVYLSVQPSDLEKSLAWIPKDRTIVTVSNHTTRSGRAADFLASRGFKVAGIVGAQNYEQEGGHLLKIDKPASSGSNSARK